MTREEKAKAYDEALEMAKNVLETDLHESGVWAIKKIFPELKESEDEKIRKRIRLCLDECVHSDIIRDYERDECLAYLEKQKEQKHCWKPTETDVALFNKAVTTNKALTPAERAQLDVIRSKFGCCRATNCSGIVQKEQKPAEWSEEDKKMLNLTIEWAEIMSDQFSFADIEPKDFRKIIAWLKSLKDRGNFLKSNTNSPSEWSEEDRDRVAQYLHDRDGGMLWSKATEITSDILDILYPQTRKEI